MKHTDIQCTHTQCAVVAGNGPSLADIDYTRLPPPPPNSCDGLEKQGYDVFRCNQFYFEDKYYLGKNVKFAFATPPSLFEQSYTYKTLDYTNHYNIQHIVVSDFNLAHMDSFYHKHLDIFDDLLCGSAYLSRLQAFYRFVRYNEIYRNKRITSGIYMCGFAAALGYKEIYITGVDLYHANKPYAFEMLKPNLLSIYPNFKLTPNDFHSKETDIEALKFLTDHYDVKLYTISPNSPLSEHIPLADKVSKGFDPIEKPQDSIKDMIIPQKFAYDNLYYLPAFIQQTPAQQAPTQANDYKQSLRENLAYKILKDIGKLPRDIARYINGRKLAKDYERIQSSEAQDGKRQTMGGGGGRSSPFLLL